MLYTSYFGKYSGSRGVAISRWVPEGITCKRVIELAPTWDMIKKYKETDDWGEFVTEYASILKGLDPFEIYAKVGEGNIMLCFEKDSERCHRHLVAQWLINNGIEVQVYKDKSYWI